jgi:hypothetical protein
MFPKRWHLPMSLHVAKTLKNIILTKTSNFKQEDSFRHKETISRGSFFIAVINILSLKRNVRLMRLPVCLSVCLCPPLITFEPIGRFL